jgi:acetoin utilization protein AcuB
MSHLPEEIDRRESLSAAIRKMEKHRIHHVPVMDGPKIFGLLSRQDVQDAYRRHGAEAEARPVGEVCTRDPLMVSPLAAIPEVARQMIGRGMTSVLVVDEGLLVGIFTSIDALRLLANL